MPDKAREYLTEAIRVFNPNENTKRYQALPSKKLQETAGTILRASLSQKLKAAREAEDNLRQKVWLIEFGDVHAEDKDYETALRHYGEALELDLDDAKVYAHRGETYRLMGEYELALADFDRALELDETYAWAYGSRGETYRLMGQYEAALADFDRAIELDPDNDWYFYGRGLVNKLVNNSEQASRDFARAITLAKETLSEKPQYWRVILNLGLYYLVTEQTEAAERLYGTARTNPVTSHHLKGAIEDLEEFLYHFPNHTSAQSMQMLLQECLDEATA
jgi:tetratricopeptide (TPR) repeat protein